MEWEGETYLDRLDLQLQGGILITDNHGMRVQLQTTQGPHVVHPLLDTSLQRQSLSGTQDDNNHLPSLQNSLHAHRQRHLGHFLQVMAEESRVRQDGVIGESLDSGPAGKGGPGLVEGNVTILTYTSQEEVDAAHALDLGFILDAFSLQVGSIAVEDVDIAWVNVHMREKVLPHEGVVGFGVVTWDADVLVHIKCDDILKGNLGRFSLDCC